MPFFKGTLYALSTVLTVCLVIRFGLVKLKRVPFTPLECNKLIVFVELGPFLYVSLVQVADSRDYVLLKMFGPLLIIIIIIIIISKIQLVVYYQCCILIG